MMHAKLFFMPVSTKIKRMIYKTKPHFTAVFASTRGMIVDQCIEEYGSGLNYNRKNGMNYWMR